MATIKRRKASLRESHGSARGIDAGGSWNRCNLANVCSDCVDLFFPRTRDRPASCYAPNWTVFILIRGFGVMARM